MSLVFFFRRTNNKNWLRQFEWIFHHLPFKKIWYIQFSVWDLFRKISSPSIAQALHLQVGKCAKCVFRGRATFSMLPISIGQMKINFKSKCVNKSEQISYIREINKCRSKLQTLTTRVELFCIVYFFVPILFMFVILFRTGFCFNLIASRRILFWF